MTQIDRLKDLKNTLNGTLTDLEQQQSNLDTTLKSLSAAIHQYSQKITVIVADFKGLNEIASNTLVLLQLILASLNDSRAGNQALDAISPVMQPTSNQSGSNYHSPGRASILPGGIATQPSQPQGHQPFNGVKTEAKIHLMSEPQKNNDEVDPFASKYGQTVDPFASEAGNSIDPFHGASAPNKNLQGQTASPRVNEANYYSNPRQTTFMRPEQQTISPTVLRKADESFTEYPSPITTQPVPASVYQQLNYSSVPQPYQHAMTKTKNTTTLSNTQASDKSGILAPTIDDDMDFF